MPNYSDYDATSRSTNSASTQPAPGESDAAWRARVSVQSSSTTPVVR